MYYTYTAVFILIDNTIYQGIIATKPRNKIFFNLIQYILDKPIILTKLHYTIFTADFYRQVKNLTGTDELHEGLNKDFYLFQEKCSKNETECKDCLDRYGLCCNIFDGEKKNFKTRYSDFPW